MFVSNSPWYCRQYASWFLASMAAEEHVSPQTRANPPQPSPNTKANVAPVAGAPRPAVLLVYLALIFMGVPVWWRTTEVYRAAIPFKMLDAVSSSCQLIARSALSAFCLHCVCVSLDQRETGLTVLCVGAGAKFSTAQAPRAPCAGQRAGRGCGRCSSVAGGKCQSPRRPGAIDVMRSSVKPLLQQHPLCSVPSPPAACELTVDNNGLCLPPPGARRHPGGGRGYGVAVESAGQCVGRLGDG